LRAGMATCGDIRALTLMPEIHNIRTDVLIF
jgi:hypothetical protein